VDDAPLSGFTVGITADRRRDELEQLLLRRGAAVVSGPALRILALAEDDALRATTRALLTEPPDVLVVNTGVGFRGWMEAAEGWGTAAALLDGLRRARILTRGPKATGAVHAAGLREEWSPPSESSDEVLERLLRDGVAGARVAVQLHGEPQTAFCDALRAAGAEVVEAPVYRWVPPADLAPLRRLTDAVLGGGVDALAFTSAPAVVSLLDHAGARRDALLAAMRGIVVVCVGPVCARPLGAADVPVLLPERMRLGAMVRLLADALPARAPVLQVAGHRLQVRGRAAVVDDRLVALAPGPLAVLRALAERPGRVVSREVLLVALPGAAGDGHAVETTVSRLRAALGAPAIVQTVVKRGYRLAATGDACTGTSAGAAAGVRPR
jgi:uroporphyrinogen-III synthase